MLPPRSPGRASGLTLIELLITTAVAGILLAVGVPSFLDFITSNRASGYASDLIADMNYARSEAIARGMRVVVCKGPVLNVSDNCTTGHWEGGWKVFVDCNNNNARTTTAVCPDWDGNGAADAEPILREHEPVASGWTIRGNGTINNRVSFSPVGLAQSPTTGTIRICRNGGLGGLVDSNLGRALILNRTGRLRMATDTDNNGTLDDDSNNELSCTP